jgi:hypothetical protein
MPGVLCLILWSRLYCDIPLMTDGHVVVALSLPALTL